jgi:hypothetical protein
VENVWHFLATVGSSTVIAAFVGAVVAYLTTAIRDARQRRRDRDAKVKQERAAAYGELLARSFTVARRIQAARLAMQFRSGLQEGLSIHYPRRPREGDWRRRLILNVEEPHM